MHSPWWIVAALCAPWGIVSCSHREASPPPPEPSSQGPLLPPPPPQAPLLPPPTAAIPTPAAQTVPTGPRDQENDRGYVLTAAITPAPAPPDAIFTLEIHGADGYHVNDQYPIRVDLEAQNATLPKSTLRRADATAYEQSGARFTLAVHPTGAGAIVRGRAVFAVCSAENCVPQARSFAVTL